MHLHKQQNKSDNHKKEYHRVRLCPNEKLAYFLHFRHIACLLGGLSDFCRDRNFNIANNILKPISKFGCFLDLLQSERLWQRSMRFYIILKTKSKCLCAHNLYFLERFTAGCASRKVGKADTIIAFASMHKPKIVCRIITHSIFLLFAPARFIVNAFQSTDRYIFVWMRNNYVIRMIGMLKFMMRTIYGFQRPPILSKQPNQLTTIALHPHLRTIIHDLMRARKAGIKEVAQ